MQKYYLPVMKMMMYTQAVAADLLNGKFFAKGKLPVTICDAL